MASNFVAKFAKLADLTFIRQAVFLNGLQDHIFDSGRLQGNNYLQCLEIW